MATAVSNDRRQLYTWTGLTADENGDAVKLDGGWGIVATVTCFGGGGSGFNSGTVTIQVSNDGTNYATLKDIHGNNVTFTENGTAEISTVAQFIRPSCDSSIDDIDVQISFG